VNPFVGIQLVNFVCHSDDSKYDCTANPTIKKTLVFNSFVLCQIVNEINCRKVNKELNPFKNFF